MSDYDWIYSLKPQVSSFMDSMKSRSVPGYYRYSYSGDLYDDKIRWNVGSSVFALKIFYTLGTGNSEDIGSACRYVKSFMHDNSLIYDDFIYKRGFIKNSIRAISDNNIGNLFNLQYKRAEARQCYSALLLFDALPEESINFDIPESRADIDKFLNHLNWNQPWSAGSHFSHLMFFLNLSMRLQQITEDLFRELKSHALDYVGRLQSGDDGAWYTGSPSVRLKINGAMKIITGLIAVDHVDFNHSKKLIDLCLAATNDETACDHFNIILVLNYASRNLDRNYRQDEIEEFAMSKLQAYKKHYFEDYGGFSFLLGHANSSYYGVKISKGLNEPDMHGTIMFLWGISVIAQILNIEDKLQFKEHKT